MPELFARQPKRLIFLGLPVHWLAVLLGCVSLMLAMTAETFAQPQPPGRPGLGRPRPGAPNTGKKTTTPTGKKGTSGAGTTAEPPKPPQTLPADYQPPGVPPEIMTDWVELLTPAEREEFKKIRNKYSSALRNGATSASDREALAQGLKYRVQIMSMKDQLRELHDRRIELVAQDLQQAGRIMKADEVKAFRRTVLEQVVKYAEPMLQGNFYSRIQAATLLGELDLVTEDTIRNLKHETYTPACEPLLKVLLDPKQPVAVKITAARSMVRLVKFGDVPVELRHRIATGVLSELAKADTHYWYQMRLAEILACLDVTLDLQSRKPFVVNGLDAALRDSRRDFRARAKPARALGRVPFDREVDVSALNRDLMQLALEMATAAQENPTDTKWKQCFFDLYLAYKPLDSTDKDATRKTPAGLLNNPQAQTAAQQTYRLILPMVNAVINNRAIGVPDVQALQAWLQTNAPAGNAVNSVSGSRTGTTPMAQPTSAPAQK